jgi:hypothetical protein
VGFARDDGLDEEAEFGEHRLWSFFFSWRGSVGAASRPQRPPPPPPASPLAATPAGLGKSFARARETGTIRLFRDGGSFFARRRRLGSNQSSAFVPILLPKGTTKKKKARRAPRRERPRPSSRPRAPLSRVFALKARPTQRRRAALRRAFLHAIIPQAKEERTETEQARPERRPSRPRTKKQNQKKTGRRRPQKRKQTLPSLSLCASLSLCLSLSRLILFFIRRLHVCASPARARGATCRRDADPAPQDGAVKGGAPAGARVALAPRPKTPRPQSRGATNLGRGHELLGVLPGVDAACVGRWVGLGGCGIYGGWGWRGGRVSGGRGVAEEKSTQRPRRAEAFSPTTGGRPRM